MKICKDGRVWGQNNKGASEHLGILVGRKPPKGIGEGKYVRTEAIRKAASKKKMGKSFGTGGDRHWNWRGGITSAQAVARKRIEYRLWREAVFARDNWTCQECGQHGGKLHPHHIKSFAEYPESRYAIDNGRTLCLKCHKLTDNYCKRGK